MKWQGSLLLATILASGALAQEPQASAVTPPAPTFAAGEMPGCAPDMCPGPAARGDRLSGNHNFDHFINWMSNPIQNIDPRAVTAIYPIFGNEWVSSAAPFPDGDFQLYGPGITIALSERFAMGLSQGGYAAAHFTRNQVTQLSQLDPLGRFRDIETGGVHQGWLNPGGFFQYTLIENVENQFLLTGGLRWEAPAGSHEIFQGHGPAHLAPYLTAGKEFDKFHVLATVGYQFPAGPGSDVTRFFNANVHFDRQVFGWLYPLVEFNDIYHTTRVSFGLPTKRGFIDMDTFEATGNIVTLAAGANAVLVPAHVEIGAVYTTAIASQRSFDANGLLVKMTLRY